jgi:hypothetical protein
MFAFSEVPSAPLALQPQGEQYRSNPGLQETLYDGNNDWLNEVEQHEW